MDLPENREHAIDATFSPRAAALGADAGAAGVAPDGAIAFIVNPGRLITAEPLLKAIHGAAYCDHR